MLTEATPALASLLRDHQVTALIALSDRMAREYHFWLKSVGIAVPENLSIVSFDNSPDSIAFPISTVDFGFSSLAYQAAHLFVGDIRVQADRLGNIASRPRLLERGSLGLPRRGRLVR
jgi:DNA-binding LacI/PurR family transcriptional regulator